MKIPQIFVIERTGTLEKIEESTKKEHKHSLEDFIIDKKIMGYERLDVSNIDDNDFLHVRGIEPELVEKAVFAEYHNYSDPTVIMLVQYKTKEGFTKNLRKLFKKGILFYEQHRDGRDEGGFIDRFLFKNNIAVYLQGNDDFNKRAAIHYRKLGFKQIDYKLKMV